MAPRMRGNRSAGIIRTYEIHPSPEEIYHDMLELEHRISDYSRPLRWSKQTLIKDTKMTFKLERDPITGAPWKKWSPMYEEYVTKRGQTKKLQRNWTEQPRRMYRAATRQRNWRIVRGMGVQFNYTNLPAYWVLHQQPDNISSPRAASRATATRVGYHARKFKQTQGREAVAEIRKKNPTAGRATLVRLLDERATQYGEKQAKREVRDVGGGSNKIPQRRFLGVSVAARTEIQGAFDDWATGILIWVERENRVSIRRLA